MLYAVNSSTLKCCTTLTALTVPQCTALLCTTLHCTVPQCTTLLYTTLHDFTLNYTVLHCTALLYTKWHCFKLSCTAIHCIAMHCTALNFTALHCSTLSLGVSLQGPLIEWICLDNKVSFIPCPHGDKCPNRGYRTGDFKMALFHKLKKERKFICLGKGPKKKSKM